MTFEGLELRPQLLKAVLKCGYETPTPIQCKAIPPALEGKDVMGLAQTGTGKTAAFMLPIIQRLMQGPRGRVRAVIIAPTRELAEQINDSFLELGRESKLKSVVIYGGVGMNPQIQKIRQGAEVVIACPGRLLDHISNGRINLRGVEILVLDEADRMFDMGFLPDIRKIVASVPATRQTLLYSATMPSDIRKLANEILNNPVTVQINHEAPTNTVSHALYPVQQHLKTALLMELLKETDTESVLIFTRTKHRAKRVAEHLEKAGHSATSLQGDMAQAKRQSALDGFRNGKHQILVATDIAARGIDVSKISHVINYDMPDTADAYTHRIGRTGRAAKTGDAFTLVSPEDSGMVQAITRLLGSRPEMRKIQGFEYAVPAPAGTPSSDRPARGYGRPSGPSGARPPKPFHSSEPKSWTGKPAAGPRTPSTRPAQHQERRAGSDSASPANRQTTQPRQPRFGR